MMQNPQNFAALLPRVRRKVYDLLMTGQHLSATDISVKTGVCDPRGHIRDLRKMGVAIVDYWVTPSPGVKYKRYYIP